MVVATIARRRSARGRLSRYCVRCSSSDSAISESVVLPATALSLRGSGRCRTHAGPGSDGDPVAVLLAVDVAERQLVVKSCSSSQAVVACQVEASVKAMPAAGSSCMRMTSGWSIGLHASRRTRAGRAGTERAEVQPTRILGRGRVEGLAELPAERGEDAARCGRRGAAPVRRTPRSSRSRPAASPASEPKLRLQLLHQRLVVGVEGAELLLEQMQLVLYLQRRGRIVCVSDLLVLIGVQVQ